MTYIGFTSLLIMNHVLLVASALAVTHVSLIGTIILKWMATIWPKQILFCTWGQQATATTARTWVKNKHRVVSAIFLVNKWNKSFIATPYFLGPCSLGKSKSHIKYLLIIHRAHHLVQNSLVCTLNWWKTKRQSFHLSVQSLC